jgi:hypothetical protein
VKIPPEFLVPRKEFVIPKDIEEAIALKERMLEAVNTLDGYLGTPEKEIARKLKTMSYTQWKTGIMNNKTKLVANYRLVKLAINEATKRKSRKNYKGYTLLSMSEHLYEMMNDQEERMAVLREKINDLRDPGLMPRQELIGRVSELVRAFDFVDALGEEEDEDPSLHVQQVL